jgi:hypothetical protein
VPVLAEAAREIEVDGLVLEDPWRVDLEGEQEAEERRGDDDRAEPDGDRDRARNGARPSARAPDLPNR